MELICPVCGNSLQTEAARYVCGSGHSFDRAKSGYVNLLQRQRHRQRGDDAEMAKSRQIFLNAGYYQPLLDRLLTIIAQRKPQQILDVGCGEGWYSCAVLSHLREMGIPAELCGIDISPEILRYAANRSRQQGSAEAAKWAVASVNRMPVRDCTCDCILNLFAPCEPREFRRVLQPDGILLRVIPLERHLWGMKTVLYEHPYENRPVFAAPEGFVLAASETLDFSITVPAEHLKALFSMTPYVHKTSPADIAKLDRMDALTTEVAFGILLCEPR